ncbi:MAG: hypothetical protein M3Y66_05865 [Actinomycetota bacterium]|nr:hypothetical protein [Actinomycetota bacterium]
MGIRAIATAAPARPERRPRLKSMTATKFDEDNSYPVRRLRILDIDGNPAVVQDVAVVFTPGWIFVQEARSDGY